MVFDIDRPSSATYNDRDDTSPTNSDHENFEADSSDLVSSSEEAIAKKKKFRRKKANLAILRARISQVCREVLTRLEPVNPIIHQFTEKNRDIKNMNPAGSSPTIYFFLHSGYSYGTCTQTCICYSYGILLSMQATIPLRLSYHALTTIL